VTHQPTSAPGGLDAARVGDVMSSPLVTCAPDVPLVEVAELMAQHRIHAVVVPPDPAGPVVGRPWSVISEIDLVAAAPFDDPDVSAGRVAGTPVVQVDRDESLARAAMLMAEYAVTHLIVVGADGDPAGIVSALDVARALAPPPPSGRGGRAEAQTPAGGLRASPGDRLVVSGHHLGEPERDAEILEARGPGGGPPFLVRWEDGRESLLYPGSDASVQRLVDRP